MLPCLAFDMTFPERERYSLLIHKAKAEGWFGNPGGDLTDDQLRTLAKEVAEGRRTK